MATLILMARVDQLYTVEWTNIAMGVVAQVFGWTNIPVETAVNQNDPTALLLDNPEREAWMTHLGLGRMDPKAKMCRNSLTCLTAPMV